MKLTPEERAEAEKTWGMAFDENGFGDMTVSAGEHMVTVATGSQFSSPDDVIQVKDEETLLVDGIEISRQAFIDHINTLYPDGPKQVIKSLGFGQYQK